MRQISCNIPVATFYLPGIVEAPHHGITDRVHVQRHAGGKTLSRRLNNTLITSPSIFQKIFDHSPRILVPQACSSTRFPNRVPVLSQYVCCASFKTCTLPSSWLLTMSLLISASRSACTGSSFSQTSLIPSYLSTRGARAISFHGILRVGGR
ncbi:hypothetical protein BJX99DRAFT_151165 [Aspergillus californicus]